MSRVGDFPADQRNRVAPPSDFDVSLGVELVRLRRCAGGRTARHPDVAIPPLSRHLRGTYVGVNADAPGVISAFAARSSRRSRAAGSSLVLPSAGTDTNEGSAPRMERELPAASTSSFHGSKTSRRPYSRRRSPGIGATQVQAASRARRRGRDSPRRGRRTRSSQIVLNLSSSEGHVRAGLAEELQHAVLQVHAVKGQRGSIPHRWIRRARSSINSRLCVVRIT